MQTIRNYCLVDEANCSLPLGKLSSTTHILRFPHLVPALVAWDHLCASLIHLCVLTVPPTLTQEHRGLRFGFQGWMLLMNMKRRVVGGVTEHRA